jgi:hypothetical protein
MPDNKVTSSQEPDAAYLAGIKDRLANAINMGWATKSGDTSRLLAAVEAALALHVQESRIGHVVFCEVHQSPPWEQVCTDCVVTYYQRCKHCGCNGPCPTYLAIARALTGKDGTDEV